MDPERSMPAPSRVPFLELREASRHWQQVVALQGLDLRIERGQRLAIIGPSGSGKSTLLQLLAASLKTSTGHVLVDGKRLDEMPAQALRSHRRRCGIVHQNALLIPQLTVHRNVLSGMIAGWPWYRTLLSSWWPVESESVAALLRRLQLADRQWQLAAQLSGGEQQRIAVARALIHQPELVLADEPTAALDPHAAQEVAQLLLEDATDRGATLIVCTHWVSLVTHAVDRVVGLREGKLLFDLPADKLSEGHLKRLYAGSDERR